MKLCHLKSGSEQDDRDRQDQEAQHLLPVETRRAGDIRYPYVVRRDWITTSGKRTKALAVSDAVINPDAPQELFERP